VHPVPANDIVLTIPVSGVCNPLQQVVTKVSVGQNARVHRRTSVADMPIVQLTYVLQ
jgi:hypothetical protein